MPLPPPMGGSMFAMPGMPFNLIMLAEQLELTKEQRDRAGKILDETMPKLRALMFRMIDARKAGRELKSAEASDSDLRKHAEEQGEIVTELTYLGLKARADLRALLTEDQRKKLDSFGEGRGPVLIHRFGHMGSFDPAGMGRARPARS
jgi:Spy/CpxP family protein refolding chaperone